MLRGCCERAAACCGLAGRSACSSESHGPRAAPRLARPARSIFKPQFQGGGALVSAANGNGTLLGPPSSSSSSEDGGAAAAASPGVAASRWFLTDRIATLREAFRRTPKWLGFNIGACVGLRAAAAALLARATCSWTAQPTHHLPHAPLDLH